jgi:tetratricopeptide (TPR) repeat protein
MSPANKNSVSAILVALLMPFYGIAWSTSSAAQNRPENPAQVDTEMQICDLNADFALGHEDYPAAILLHRGLLQKQPANALAHYHLGFAYGMTGNTSEELTEYLTAAGLGLKSWDLFLNLGLAYLGQHQLERATEAFATAVALGPEHAEAHFNLALAYESTNHLDAALGEIETARRLAPRDPDVANTNAIICVETGDMKRARELWTDLIQLAPDYAPAHANLAILNRSFALNGQVERHSELSFAETGAYPAARIGDSSNLQTVTALNGSLK